MGMAQGIGSQPLFVIVAPTLLARSFKIQLSPPYFEMKCFSTRPVASMIPMTSSHRKNTLPTTGCMMVAASS